MRDDNEWNGNEYPLILDDETTDGSVSPKRNVNEPGSLNIKKIKYVIKRRVTI